MSGLEQPKKPAGGGFGRFVAEKRAEFQAKCAGQPVSAVSKMAGQVWGALSDEQKEPYKKKFVEAQAKYTADMEAFLAAGGEKQKGAAALRTEKRKAKEGKVKKQKDPDAPKRPAGGAYGCFMAANRAEFTKQCPGSMTAVGKLAGEKWRAASAAEKEKYEKEYKVKADAYQEAMKSYEPPAVEENDEDIKETPAKKAKISQENKASAKEDKKAAAEEKKAAAATKKATKSVGKPAKATKSVAKAAPAGVELSPDIITKARSEGYEAQLKNLALRPEVVASGKSAADLLKAIKASNGLVNPAKRMLLGA